MSDHHPTDGRNETEGAGTDAAPDTARGDTGPVVLGSAPDGAGPTADEALTAPIPLPGADTPAPADEAAARTGPTSPAPPAPEAPTGPPTADEALTAPIPLPGAVTERAAQPAPAPAQAGVPGPRPGGPVPRPPRSGRPRPPRPQQAPRPAAVAVTPGPSPVAAASPDPSRWGRADEDGTIHLHTAEGERVVGSWQAGTPGEGLAHFARRFDDLLTEAELLAARVESGGDAKQALTAARALRGGLDDAAVVGDLAGLVARVDEIVARAEHALGEARSVRDAQRVEATARKESLAAEAESLAADATQWKQAGDRFKAILDEWRAIRGIDRKTDEQLWKRFSKAREAFNRRRGSHFAELDRQRASAKSRKEELVGEAEKIADSDDWGPTAARFRELMADWKGAGRAQKDADDALWQRFRAAQDAFFARRSHTFAERDAEFVANAEAKQALLAEAEKIDVSDPNAARAALRDVHARWEAIGKVPRDDIRPLEARLRAVEERVREAADRQWRRTDPEAEARVAQFRDRVAQFESQAEKARAAGDARRAAQAQAQADQWREWLATAEQSVQHR